VRGAVTSFGGSRASPRANRARAPYKVQVRFVAAVSFVLLVGCTPWGSGQPPKATPSDPFVSLRSAPLKLQQLAAGQPCPKAEPRDRVPLRA